MREEGFTLSIVLTNDKKQVATFFWRVNFDIMKKYISGGPPFPKELPAEKRIKYMIKKG